MHFLSAVHLLPISIWSSWCYRTKKGSLNLFMQSGQSATSSTAMQTSWRDLRLARQSITTELREGRSLRTRGPANFPPTLQSSQHNKRSSRRSSLGTRRNLLEFFNFDSDVHQYTKYSGKAPFCWCLLLIECSYYHTFNLLWIFAKTQRCLSTSRHF